MFKNKNDNQQDAFIPVSDTKDTKFMAPLIVVSYQFGEDVKIALEKGEKVLLSVDFDAVTL